MKLVNNIVGLFFGENSKKRQIGIMAGGVAMVAYLLGWLDFEQFKVAMFFVTFWTGAAFSARMTKMAKALKK